MSSSANSHWLVSVTGLQDLDWGEAQFDVVPLFDLLGEYVPPSLVKEAVRMLWVLSHYHVAPTVERSWGFVHYTWEYEGSLFELMMFGEKVYWLWHTPSSEEFTGTHWKLNDEVDGGGDGEDYFAAVEGALAQFLGLI